MKPVSAALSRPELLGWAANSVAFYGLDCSRLGTVLLAQLLYAETERTLSVFNVTDEIKYLEGVGPKQATVPADPFNHPPLIGFYKKHFTSPRFMAKNLLNYAKSKAGKKHHHQAWTQATAKSKGGTLDSAFLAHYVHETTVGYFNAKARQESITGEWIVFKVFASGNYYFTLASHTESNHAIYERITFCANVDNLCLNPDDAFQETRSK